MAKDFKGIAAGKVTQNTIAQATQEEQPTRKPRKTYTKQEAADFSQELKTAGRKGIKLPRINLAFTPEMYDYVKTMSKFSGQTYTEFINKLLQAHKEEHADTYKKIVALRDSL